MRNPSVYIGFTLISDEEDGHKRVSTFDGLMYAGLDDLQVTMLEDIMTSEFAEEFDKLKQKMRIRMVEMGYTVAEASGADVSSRPKKENKPTR